MGFGKGYFHSPASVPLTFRLISHLANNETDSTDANDHWAGLIALILPEGFGRNYKLGDDLSVIVNVNPFGFEYIKSRDNETFPGWYWSGNFGVELNKFIDKNWFVGVSGNIKTTFLHRGLESEYRDWRYGSFFGISVGRMVLKKSGFQ